MFDLNPEDVLNKNFRDLMIPEHLTLVDEFMKEIEESNEGALQKQLELMLKDRALTVLLTVTTIKDESGNDTGMVVMFEDMTQLQRAERAAAWREVARRMAHEIKNPLTPIQLSAQRLQKKYSEKLEDGSVFKECTQIIIDQVEVLKNLVNEFSRYARMPVTTPAPNDLNEVIADSVSLFQDAHKDITFEFKKAENMPKFEFDAEQMNRVLINLLDNAVAAINDNKGGKIEITAGYDEQSRRATVAVADDGSGVPANYKGKVFDPYFSTKKSGTGLGLAIVNSIISDHHGQVSVSDNFPTGTVVSFQLPVSGV